MKLILLRHEERDLSDPRFFTPLTTNGKENALSLVLKLNQLENQNIHIDYIFSSPFLRTLQTIYPYAKSHNLKVNTEYGLYEYIHNPIFELKLDDWYHTIDEFYNKDFNYIYNIINTHYKSIVKKEDFHILENHKSLENRIIKFFNYLLTNYRDKTILIVSHMGTINSIKNIYIEPTNMNKRFEMGHFEIYDL